MLYYTIQNRINSKLLFINSVSLFFGHFFSIRISVTEVKRTVSVQETSALSFQAGMGSGITIVICFIITLIIVFFFLLFEKEKHKSNVSLFHFFSMLSNICEHVHVCLHILERCNSRIG